MNKRVLNISLFLLLASTGNVLAQQGIGTNTPHRSAALHVDSQNKGLLIPRMNLTHSQTDGITGPITNPAQGLLVYNNQSYPENATGQEVLVPEGFYYFDGTNWNPISKSYLENSSYTTIWGTGTSSDPYKINLVHASSTEYGVVKIGSGINVNDGVISVNFPPNTIDTNTTTTVSKTQSYITVESSHTVGDSTSPLQTVNYEIGVDPATETSLGVVAPGAGLAIADGILSVDISTIGNKGNLTSTAGDDSITVTNGTGATLVNTNIKVSDLGITTGKLAEGAVTPAKVEAGTNNTVLSTDESGTVVWVDKSTLDTNTTYSAGSGISLDGTQFSVPVTTTGNGNVLTSVTATATGLEFTKEPFAATDTRTKVEAIANRPITVTSDAFTVGEENTYTLDLKVGSGLEVESDGTLKVAFNDTDNQTITDLSLNATQLSITLERGGAPVTVDLTALTNTTNLGNGTNTTVSGNGSATTPYEVNVATGNGTTLGVVRQADTAPSVTVTDGVLAVVPGNVAITNALTSSGNQMSSTVNGGTAQTASIINTNALSLNGDNHLVSTINGIPSSALDLSAAVQAAETLTSITQDATSGVITYKRERDADQTANVVNATSDNLISYDAGAFLNATTIQNNQLNTVVAQGTGITVTPSTSGNTTTYTVAANPVDAADLTNKGTLSVSGGLEFTGSSNGTDKLLANAGIGVANGGIDNVKLANNAVTSIKIADGTIETIDLKDSAVTPAKIEAGANNTVLSTDESGNVVWVDKSTLDTDTTYSAGSGISLDGTQFSVPVTTTGNGNVLTGVTATATGLEFTKESFAATDTRTKVEAIPNRPITVTSNVFTVGGENTYTLDLKVGSGLEVESDGTLKVAFNDTDNQQISYNAATRMLSLERGGDPVDLSALATDNNTITTVKADAAQSYVSVTSNPVTPGATLDREYTVGVSAATAQVGEADGTLGVVKPSDQFEIASDGYLKIKYATPEFFYMPALLIPLSGDTNAEGFLSLDLHGEYQERFSTPAVVSTNPELANLSSLVVPMNKLDIYITYFDEQVLEDVSIDTDGIMWYKVKANYNYTEASFMNVVFKVRNQPKQ